MAGDMREMAARGSGGWVNRLWFAVENSDQRALRLMVTHGANINHVFKAAGHKWFGMTPLQIAVAKNNRELVNFLIGLGCDLESRGASSETALMTAMRFGKMPMIKHLIAAGANINCRNKNNETVLFIAIRNFRKDLVEFVIQHGIDTNLPSKDGTTPLLETLRLYECSCSVRHATRRHAPDIMAEIIQLLIPLSSCLNYHHSNLGTALRLALSIETTHFHEKLTISKMLMQHGAIPDRLFFLRFGGLRATTTQPNAEFFTEEFFDIAYLAGANLQREKTWLLTVLSEMRQELVPYEHLFEELARKALSPSNLQTLCIIHVRKHLGGNLWNKINCLPLPPTIQECLKLKHFDSVLKS